MHLLAGEILGHLLSKWQYFSLADIEISCFYMAMKVTSCNIHYGYISYFIIIFDKSPSKIYTCYGSYWLKENYFKFSRLPEVQQPPLLLLQTLCLLLWITLFEKMMPDLCKLLCWNTLLVLLWFDIFRFTFPSLQKLKLKLNIKMCKLTQISVFVCNE